MNDGLIVNKDLIKDAWRFRKEIKTITTKSSFICVDLDGCLSVLDFITGHADHELELISNAGHTEQFDGC